MCPRRAKQKTINRGQLRGDDDVGEGVEEEEGEE